MGISLWIFQIKETCLTWTGVKSTYNAAKLGRWYWWLPASAGITEVSVSGRADTLAAVAGLQCQDNNSKRGHYTAERLHYHWSWDGWLGHFDGLGTSSFQQCGLGARSPHSLLFVKSSQATCFISVRRAQLCCERRRDQAGSNDICSFTSGMAGAPYDKLRKKHSSSLFSACKSCQSESVCMLTRGRIQRLASGVRRARAEAAVSWGMIYCSAFTRLMHFLCSEPGRLFSPSILKVFTQQPSWELIK